MSIDNSQMAAEFPTSYNLESSDSLEVPTQSASPVATLGSRTYSELWQPEEMMLT